MATAEEIAAHNEKILRNIDRNLLVEKFALSLGCDDAQASTISKAYSERFEFDGAVLSFKGQPVTQARDAVLAHFRENKLDFLLPKAGETETPDIDPHLLESARAGNQTSRQAIYKKLGDIAATDALIAKKPVGKDDNADHDASTNPWAAKDFRSNKDAQQKAAGIIARLGTRVAANLAKAAGKTLDGRQMVA
ncbi:MAG: hypothetical protein WA850_18030 [Xanthobacteraceae bacterium]